MSIPPAPGSLLTEQEGPLVLCPYVFSIPTLTHAEERPSSTLLSNASSSLSKSAPSNSQPQTPGNC